MDYEVSTKEGLMTNFGFIEQKNFKGYFTIFCKSIVNGLTFPSTIITLIYLTLKYGKEHINTYYGLYFLEIFNILYVTILILMLVFFNVHNISILYILYFINIIEIVKFILGSHSLIEIVKYKNQNIYLVTILHSLLIIINFLLILSFLSFGNINISNLFNIFKELISLKAFRLWNYGIASISKNDILNTISGFLCSVSIIKNLKSLYKERREIKHYNSISSRLSTLGKFRKSDFWLSKVSDDKNSEFYCIKSKNDIGLNKFSDAKTSFQKTISNSDNSNLNLYFYYYIYLNSTFYPYILPIKKKIFTEILNSNIDGVTASLILLLEDVHLITHFCDEVSNKKNYCEINPITNLFMNIKVNPQNVNFKNITSLKNCKALQDKIFINFLIIRYSVVPLIDKTKCEIIYPENIDFKEYIYQSLEEFELLINDIDSEFNLYFYLCIYSALNPIFKEILLEYKDIYLKVLDSLTEKIGKVDSYIMKSELKTLQQLNENINYQLESISEIRNYNKNYA